MEEGKKKSKSKLITINGRSWCAIPLLYCLSFICLSKKQASKQWREEKKILLQFRNSSNDSLQIAIFHIIVTLHSLKIIAAEILFHIFFLFCFLSLTFLPETFTQNV